MKANNRLIFKNTLFLYGREAVTLLLTLYCSRLLLEQLGIEDFGLYGLIGSILAIFSSLRGLFATSIQRFINVAKGTGSTESINKIFSIGLLIHIAIAILFIILVEIAGIIIIPTLNIATESISSAYWILHFSVLAAAITIITVPYDALIIANERFNIYAVFSIIEAILKLCIIFLLCYSPISKVVYYALLMLVVALIVRSINAIYCKYTFREESQFRYTRDKELLKQMSTFAGWQFFGNMGFSLMHTGLNFVINIFGGVAVNAARAIAYQVQNAVSKLAANINISFQPQSIMLYSQGHMEDYYKMMILNSKTSFAITAIMSVVIIIMAPIILELWLGDVPEYTTEMVQAIFAYNIVRSLHSPIDTLFKASGKLKHFQICELVILALNLPISWIVLKLGYPYYSVFIVMAIVEFVNLIAVLTIAQKHLKFNSVKYTRDILYRVVIYIAVQVSIFTLVIDKINVNTSMIVIVLQCCTLLVFATLSTIAIVFNKEEIKTGYNIILRKIK